MALRVLLADESTTIKKVMQLALQDFAVEVKAVQSGLDVVEVAKSFLPDIIFSDVLLQKKNGYEVCADLKKDPTLKAIPLVLMWSSFMDLDEQQAVSCGCDKRLEKPFEVETLRQIILELVPKTRTQRLAHFLNFPKPPLETPPPRQNPSSNSPSVHQGHEQKQSTWNMESFDDIENITDHLPPVEPDQEHDSEDAGFKEIRITAQNSPPSLVFEDEAGAIDANEIGAMPANDEKEITVSKREKLSAEDRDPWSHQDLARFKLDLQPIETNEGLFNTDGFPESELQEIPNVPENLDTTEFPSYLHRTGSREIPIPPPTNEKKREQLEKGPRGRDEIDLEIDESTSEMVDLTLIRPTPGIVKLTSNATANSDEFSWSESLVKDTNRENAQENTKKSLKKTSATSGQADLPPTVKSEIPKLSSEQLESIIRAQSREIIEDLVRKVVPDLATDLIRQELSRLLEER